MMKKLVVLAAAMLLVIPVLSVGEEAPQFGKDVGQKLKPFDLPSVGGKNVSLESLLGKKTVIIFMQSSCTQCRDEMKAVNEMYDKIKEKWNVVAVGVDIDPARLDQYKTAYKIQFPMLRDPDFSVPTSVGVRVTPATIVLDKDGTIEQKITGGMGMADVEDLFSKL